MLSEDGRRDRSNRKESHTLNIEPQNLDRSSTCLQPGEHVGKGDFTRRLCRAPHPKMALGRELGVGFRLQVA